jgi:hypothetical protein
MAVATIRNALLLIGHLARLHDAKSLFLDPTRIVFSGSGPKALAQKTSCLCKNSASGTPLLGKGRESLWRRRLGFPSFENRERWGSLCRGGAEAGKGASIQCSGRGRVRAPAPIACPERSRRVSQKRRDLGHPDVEVSTESKSLEAYSRGIPPFAKDAKDRAPGFFSKILSDLSRRFCASSKSTSKAAGKSARSTLAKSPPFAKSPRLQSRRTC